MSCWVCLFSSTCTFFDASSFCCFQGDSVTWIRWLASGLFHLLWSFNFKDIVSLCYQYLFLLFFTAMQCKTFVLTFWCNCIYNFLQVHFIFRHKNFVITMSNWVYFMPTNWYSGHILYGFDYYFTVHIKHVGWKHTALPNNFPLYVIY